MLMAVVNHHDARISGLFASNLHEYVLMLWADMLPAPLQPLQLVLTT